MLACSYIIDEAAPGNGCNFSNACTAFTRQVARLRARHVAERAYATLCDDLLPALEENGIPLEDARTFIYFRLAADQDQFLTIAKFRALRRFYARMMRDEFGAEKPESQRLRFHTQTAAATLTKPQPHNNIVRTTLQALAAVLGGTQSLHTNGLDEAYTIPSEHAMRLALRTQQIIAEESHVPDVIDPLAGSYFIEAMTNRMEAEIQRYLERIDELGGTVAAIEQGWFQREIADTAYEIAKQTASGDRTVVGVNKYLEAGEDQHIEVHRNDPDTERRQIERLRRVREARDQRRVDELLARMRALAKDPEPNLMPITIEAVKAHASMGEIVGALKEVYGVYRETPSF